MTAQLPHTIMVVEDDTNLLAGICDILEGSDYAVLPATDGRRALHQLRTIEQLPSLIVSDVNMPYMDGYELLDAVRQEKDWTEIPFVFLTALTEPHQFRRGMIAGVDDYMAKPFTPEELILTIRTKLRRRTQLANVRSAQIKKVKHDILTILNHEFRTPLTPMVAYADMLNTDPVGMSEDEMRMFIQGINTGAQRLRQLVEDFLALIELETGEASAEFEARRVLIDDVDSLFATAIRRTMDLAAAKYLELSAQPVASSLPRFTADPEYLLGALVRLIDNAIKFTDEPGKHIYLSTHTDGEHVLLSVTDEGRGIPPSEFGQIFDPFYQINREHFEDQGAGSGLAIVKGIMNLHGGDILLESEPHVGSRFTLSFPIASLGVWG